MENCRGYKKSIGTAGFFHKATNKEHYKCQAKGVLFEDGKWWCKRHAPSEKLKREEKSEAIYMARIRKNLDKNK